MPPSTKQLWRGWHCSVRPVAPGGIVQGLYEGFERAPQTLAFVRLPQCRSPQVHIARGVGRSCARHAPLRQATRWTTTRSASARGAVAGCRYVQTSAGVSPPFPGRRSRCRHMSGMKKRVGSPFGVPPFLAPTGCLQWPGVPMDVGSAQHGCCCSCARWLATSVCKGRNLLCQRSSKSCSRSSWDRV